MILLWTLCLLLSSPLAYSWDTEQLEVFDAVEEVKTNFYEFLNITHDAETQAVKSAFRRLSRELHPDKNSAENAEEQFRNLVSVYDILKDPLKRKYYDEVLINGLPNWRSAVYYYRHARRIGLIEMCILLLVLLTTGQYLVSWASYFEQKYTLAQVRGKKLRQIASTIELPKPSFYNTLPCQIPRLIWTIIISMPLMLSILKQKALEKLEKPIEESSDEEPVHEIRSTRKRKPGFVVPDGPNFEVQLSTKEQASGFSENQTAPVVGGLWTDDDLTELVQLINRFPGGTPDRWKIIADSVGRSVAEVTYMANRIKSNNFKIAEEVEPEEEVVHVKKKTKGGKLDEILAQNKSDSVWTQQQQKAIENALFKYPKGSIDRWDYIAECVPGKTKDQCILRYKQIVELVKKQKENREPGLPSINEENQDA